MPVIFGFAAQRRALLEEEYLRMAGEFGRLGVERFELAGDLARGRVEPTSELEVVVVHETAEPPSRRADFFVTHLRPNVGTRFHVFTPAEAADHAATHPLLRHIARARPRDG